MVCYLAACLASRRAWRGSIGEAGGLFYLLDFIMGFERRSLVMEVSSAGRFILDFNFITQQPPPNNKIIL